MSIAPRAGGHGPLARRTGRDGRARPVDVAELRARITRAIEEQPTAPLREIARQVGASAETVRSVKARAGQPSGAVSRDDADVFAKLFDTTTVEGASLLAHVESPATGASSPTCSSRACVNVDAHERPVTWPCSSTAHSVGAP